ncbi:MAG TPA: HAD-IC family P-type ATPase, partial [Xanthomonadales bacterium]|nr:HAD-IC family P-type ATPase [Xanthomonadales bacterium]
MPDTAQLYSLTRDKLFGLFQTSDKGLSSESAKSLLTKFGPNKLTAKKRQSALSMYFEQFKNTLTIILIISAFLILFVYQFGEKDPSDLIEAGLILGIVFMITVLGFVQEFKAEKAIESLKKLLAFKAKVRRDGHEYEIDVAELVPGDIVIIEEGTKVPSDIRLLEVFSLRVNEASLTGESAPVSKTSQELTGSRQIADQTNMLFAGTNITSGRAIGLVIATGNNTEIGKIARDVANTEEEQTPIQVRLEKIGKIIGFWIVGICVLVFVFIFFFARDFQGLTTLNKIIHSFIAAVALAVAAIPEGLPAVVTISLALGTQRMLRKKALVRKLSSVETLGSTDVICSDKTGTFTKGEMTVRKIYFDGKMYEVSGTGYETKGEFSQDKKKIDPAKFFKLLETGVYCNNASIAGGKILGDPTEASLLVSAEKAGLKHEGDRVSEIPFSSERKIMSVVVKKDGKYFVYTKGAPEIVLEHCGISAADKKKVLGINKELSDQALRNLGFAYKELSASEYEKQVNDEKKIESELTFL